MALFATVVGCRAAEPARGPRASSLRIVSGTGPSIVAPTRVAYGTNGGVIPLRDYLRSNPSLLVDGLGAITWGFAGTTEEVRVEGTTLLHEANPRGALGPADLASPVALVDEQILLAATPVLGSALPAASADGLIPFGGTLEPPAPITPFENYSLLFQREVFTLTSTSVRWEESTPDPSTGATYPVLVILTEYSVDFQESDLVSTLFHTRPGAVSYEHGIAFRPCRGGRCLTSGPLFDAYRSALTRDGEDAVLPDLGLELIHQVRLVSASTRVDYDPACILTLLTVPLPIGLVIYIRDQLGVFLVATDPISAAISCESLRAGVESELDEVFVDLAGTLDTLGDLMVNPPTFRTDLETVLAVPRDASGMPYDANGDGQMSYPETRAALRDLGFSPDDANTTAIGLTNGCADAATETAFCPLNAIQSELTLTGSLAADGARPADPAPAPFGAVDGTFTDRTYDMFARGTLADVRPASVRLDLTVIRALCESGAAPDNFDLLCGACASADAPAAFCDGRRIRDYVLDPTTGTESFAVPPGALDPFAVPRVPGIARILEVAPLFAQTLRQFLVNGTAPGVRFHGASWDAAGDGGEGRARFDYIIDPDFDGLDSSVDNCPGDYNPLQFDTTELVDGRPTPDGVGDECDACPFSAGGVDARDCDCDLDRDGCNNDAPLGPPLVCALAAGRVYDRSPRTARLADLDGDGTPDDCDADTDGDDVPDALDNCPRGDGDTTYEAGVDDDPSQTDSGGVEGRGDLCDLLCPTPGSPGCSVPIGAGDERIPDDAIPFPGFLPEAGCFAEDCGVGLLSVCGARSLAECLDGPLAFGAIDLFGQPLQSYGAQTGASVLGGTLPDLDGDGALEVLVSSPDRSGACTPNGCAADVGEVLFLSGGSGATLEQLSFGEPGSSFGAAVVRSGSLLAIGAPGARDAAGVETGAVHVFDTSSGAVVFVATVYGTADGSRFGALIAPLSTKRGRPQLVIGAPGAGTVVHWDPERGELGRFSIGAVGEMTTLLAVREEDRRHGHRGPVRIVVGVPGARSGAGAVLVLDRRGCRRAAIYGRTNERLGTAIVRAEGSPDELWVGAPGHGGGRGAIVRMSLHGRRADTLVWSGRGLGSSLALTRDLNDDGRLDLLAGLELGGEPATLLVGDLVGRRHRHRR